MPSIPSYTHAFSRSLQEVGQQPAGEGDWRHVGGAHRRPPHVSTTSGLMRLFYYIFVDNVLN